MRYYLLNAPTEGAIPLSNGQYVLASESARLDDELVLLEKEVRLLPRQTESSADAEGRSWVVPASIFCVFLLTLALTSKRK